MRCILMGLRSTHERTRDEFLYLHALGAEIRDFLTRDIETAAPAAAMFHVENPAAASYVTRAGRAGIVLTVSGVARAQAAEIGARLAGDSIVSLPQFQDAVEGVIGESVNPGRPIGSYLARWHGEPDVAAA